MCKISFIKIFKDSSEKLNSYENFCKKLNTLPHNISKNIAIDYYALLIFSMYLPFLKIANNNLIVHINL